MLERYRKPILLAAAVAVAVLLYSLIDRSSQLATTVNRITQQVTQLVGGEDEPLISERVLDLPEDGQTWSSVFVWPANRESDTASQRLAGLFAAEPRLQSLLSQTKTYHYTPSDPLFAERFAPTMGAVTPQFWLLRPSENPAVGDKIYAVQGPVLPDSGKAMADEIAACIAGKCPRPKPTPEPTPPPPPPPNTPPDIGPAPEPIDESLPLWVWILPVLAGGAGALAEWRRSR